MFFFGSNTEHPHSGRGAASFCEIVFLNQLHCGDCCTLLISNDILLQKSKQKLERAPESAPRKEVLAQSYPICLQRGRIRRLAFEVASLMLAWVAYPPSPPLSFERPFACLTVCVLACFLSEVFFAPSSDNSSTTRLPASSQPSSRALIPCFPPLFPALHCPFRARSSNPAPLAHPLSLPRIPEALFQAARQASRSPLARPPARLKGTRRSALKDSLLLFAPISSPFLCPLFPFVPAPMPRSRPPARPPPACQPASQPEPLKHPHPAPTPRPCPP